MDKSNLLNPTPIAKIITVLILAFGVSYSINEICAVLIVVFISVFFTLNARVKTAIRAMIFYVFLSFGLNSINYLSDKFVLNSLVTLFGVLKIYFLPILAGNFLVSTSDVSTLIVSFEKMKFPRVIVIPLAVMFRYFPAFREDKKNIRMAMKMRRITFLNPIKYLEYISVPLLISASNIANDISKSAETKCISDPCKKTRYVDVSFGLIDIIYVFGITVIFGLGRYYA